MISIQAAFAILAGLLLVIQGMLAAAWFRKKVIERGSCLTATVFGKFLKGGSRVGVFIAGILTGFLPCGLVYSFLALATSSASIWKGPLLMTAFGMRTVPVMLVTGAGFTVASLKMRQKLMKAAAVCVLISGVRTIARGMVFAANSSTEKPQEACLFCEAKQP